MIFLNWKIIIILIFTLAVEVETFNPNEITDEIETVNKKIFKGYKMRIGKANWAYDLKESNLHEKNGINF